MKRSTSMTSPPTATRRCLEPAPMDSSSYGDHLPFLRAIRDGEVPPQFLPGGDVVRLDVEDYLPCSYAQCRHLLDAAPAHVAPRLPAAELRAKRLARFAT
ncbi:succinate transmembrane transporter [Aureococcus anophagefferens]|nr:succinate transmembrane transporter [Aureococcus anophagefferens]